MPLLKHVLIMLLIIIMRIGCRSSILVTHDYPDLGSASDLSCRVGNLIQPIRSTTQIWVVMHHQYRISVLVSQTSFAGKPVVASLNVGCFLRLRKFFWFYFLLFPMKVARVILTAVGGNP